MEVDSLNLLMFKNGKSLRFLSFMAVLGMVILGIADRNVGRVC